MEQNFSMEWNMEWKIFGMEWKWNGRKLPVWNMEKSSSIPFHTMLCLQSLICNRLRNFQIIVLRNQLQRIVIYQLQIIKPWLATTIG